jgi:lipoteichoic acid synthase
MTRRDDPLSLTFTRLVAAGGALALVLLGVRWYMRYRSYELREPMRAAAGPFAAFYFDLAFAAGLTALFAVLALLAAGRARIRRWLVAVFRAVALASLLLALVNVRALAELGRPLSYQWLYYSHFFRSLDTYNALSTILSWEWPVLALGVVALMVALEVVLFRVLRPAAERPWARLAVLATLVPLGLGLALGHWWIARDPGRDLAWMQNPTVALLQSMLQISASPVLARFDTPIGPDDFLTLGERAAGLTADHLAGDPAVRNVVIVVLESVAANYMDIYGGEHGVTPELDTLRRRGRLYANAYAHGPSTTNSLLALLASIYPWHTFRPVTRVHPTIPLPSLSEELRRHGYRTGFFNAEDNRFQRADEFLAGRFDVVTDYTDFPCDEQETDAAGKDHCVVRTFERWLNARDGGPFLAVIWTGQTHWPYKVRKGSQVLHTADTVATRFRRYLEALRDSDRAVGDMFRFLHRRELLDSTLVVLLGDHGEAFGQHGHQVHRDLYEEEVHIPLLFVNRRLFNGETDSLVAGMVDVAPTVMDLLDLPAPRDWQGRSLFDPEHSGRAYLFGPYSGLFGLREGSRKLVLDDASRHPPQLYDLAADPHEGRNIAPAHPDVVRRGRERLAAWVQYQDRFFQRVLAAPLR